MAATKFETKTQVLQYLNRLSDEDVIYYGNFILDLANRPSTNDEIALITDRHREELKQKEIEIQTLAKDKESLEKLIQKKKDYEDMLLCITENEVMKSRENVLQTKDDQIQMMKHQVQRGIEEQKAAVEGQTKTISNLQATINKFAGERQKSVTRGQQGEEFLENMLNESGAFAVVKKITDKNKGDFLVRFPRSNVEIMFENKDVSQKVKKSQKEKFQADLDNNSYHCRILVSLSEIVDDKIDQFSIHKSSKGKPFIYINKLREYEKPEIILKVACFALINSVEEGSDEQDKPARSYISEQLRLFDDLQTSSKEISKQAGQLMKQAEKNQKVVDKIYKGFEKLRKDIEEPVAPRPQTGSKRPRNEEDHM